MASNTDGIFTNLGPDSYTFVVTDSKGCSYTETYRIDPLPPVSVLANTVKNLTCDTSTDGIIEFTVGNFGTSYNYVVISPNGYSTSATGQTATSFQLTGLAAGTYTIIVTNTTTNCTATANTTVIAPPDLSATLNPNQVDCTTFSLSVIPTGGWGGYTYSISPSAGVIQSGNTFTNLQAGYTLCSNHNRRKWLYDNKQSDIYIAYSFNRNSYWKLLLHKYITCKSNSYCF